MSVNIMMNIFLGQRTKELAYMCTATACHIFGGGTRVSFDENLINCRLPVSYSSLW